MGAERGFTLIEVLVALVVATLGLLAVTLATITSSRNANDLRERTLAHWVAMNVASELRLAGDFPSIGVRDGDADFAGADWRWEADIEGTDVEGLRRIEIRVAYAATPDEPLTELVAFVGRPSPGIAYRDWTGPPAPPADAPDDDTAPR